MFSPRPCTAALPNARISMLPWNLLSLPVRRPLVEEGIHSLAEILAHVGAHDQIPALLTRQRAAETKHRSLGGCHRDRRMAGNELGSFIDTALQRRNVRHHLVE